MSDCHLRYRSDLYTIWDDCSNRLNENISIDAKNELPLTYICILTGDLTGLLAVLEGGDIAVPV